MINLFITMAFTLLFASSSGAALRSNDIAPTFSLQDSTGKDFTLSEYVGPARKESVKGVMLGFFASWCVECRKELPLINSLVDELNGKGITVVIVDVKEDRDTIDALLSELKVDRPIVLSDRYGKTAEKYGIRFLPVTYFIGADGRVKHIIFGEIPDAKSLRESAGKVLP